MGLNKDRFNAVHKFTGRSSIYKYPWGYLNPDRGELVVSKEEIFSPSLFSLKDIEYFIEEGILYIQATECEWGYIGHYLESISEWRSPHRHMYILEKDDDFLERFHVSESQVFLYEYRKNWVKRKKTIIDCSAEAASNWFRKKGSEKPFTYTLHPFKLKEITK